MLAIEGDYWAYFCVEKILYIPTFVKREIKCENKWTSRFVFIACVHSLSVMKAYETERQYRVIYL